MKLEGKKINFLGDSITFGAGLMSMPEGMDMPELPEDFDFSMLPPENNPFAKVNPDEFEHLFVNILRRKCGLAAARNYGVPGTRIARQPEGFGPDFFTDTFCDRAQRMEPDADVVVVFGGTNDFGHGYAPMGTMGDRTDATFYGALHVLMAVLIEKYPAAEIVICTPLHRIGEDDPRGDGTKKVPGPVLSEYVTAIRQVAEYYSLPLLDLYAHSGIQPNVPVIAERYCPDGLHPNEAGNQLLARRLAGFLEAL